MRSGAPIRDTIYRPTKPSTERLSILPSLSLREPDFTVQNYFNSQFRPTYSYTYSDISTRHQFKLRLPIIFNHTLINDYL